MWVFNDDFWVYRLLQMEHWMKKNYDDEILNPKILDYERKSGYPV